MPNVVVFYTLWCNTLCFSWMWRHLVWQLYTKLHTVTSVTENNIYTPWRVWLSHCTTSRKVAVSIPGGVIGIFVSISFRPLCGLGVGSASNMNEYQGYLTENEDGRCLGLTTWPTSCPAFLAILGASTSFSSQSLSIPLQGSLYLFFFEGRDVRLSRSYMRIF